MRSSTSQQPGARRVDADAGRAAGASPGAAWRRRRTARPTRSRPGTSSRSGSSRAAGHTSTPPGSERRRAPAARSIRSVWSRVGHRLDDGRRARRRRRARRAGRTTSPARSRRAARTGSAAAALASIASGRRPPSVSTPAPIRISGSAIRRIGRELSDSSPASSNRRPRWPARIPGSRRASVPALPQSIGSAGGCSPRSPTPAIRRVSPSSSTRTPSARTAAIVDSVSPERPNPVTTDSPSATAPTQNRAVGDRLVARQRNAALDGRRRLDRDEPGTGPWGQSLSVLIAGAPARRRRRSPAPRAAPQHGPPPPPRRRASVRIAAALRARSGGARSPRC